MRPSDHDRDQTQYTPSHDVEYVCPQIQLEDSRWFVNPQADKITAPNPPTTWTTSLHGTTMRISKGQPNAKRTGQVRWHTDSREYTPQNVHSC